MRARYWRKGTRHAIVLYRDVPGESSQMPDGRTILPITDASTLISAIEQSRRPLFVAIDIACVITLLIFVAGVVWGVSGWHLTYVAPLGRMPVQLLVVVVAIVPAGLSIPWLAVRKARRIQAALTRL
jgi:hypothetical protein